MHTSEIQAMQARLAEAGFYYGDIDGAFGPRSRSALQSYLASLAPTPHPFPRGDGASLRAFYGQPGDESNLVTITFPFPMRYEGRPVRTTRVHRKCAASLLAVLNDIATLLPTHPEARDEAEDYGGVYNFRLKRGGTSYSCHAYGAAIDLDADDNTFRNAWPVNADMPLAIIEAFARHGWTSAAAWWGYDAMHFQATQP